MRKITSIQDVDGRVWTGLEVDASSDRRDAGANSLPSGLAGNVFEASTIKCVEVNGELHYGREVNTSPPSARVILLSNLAVIGLRVWSLFD